MEIMMFGKKKAGAIAAGLSLVMALAPAVPAFAATTDTGVVVTKNLMLNEGSTVDATFSFTATADQLDVQTKDGKTEKTAPTSEVPAITIADIEFKADSEQAGKNTKTTAIALADGASFPHAGIYAWRIHETTDNQTGVQYNTENNAYTLIANVVNAKNEDGTYKKDAEDNQVLEATYVVVKNDTTTSITNQEKAGNEGAEFTNKYTEPADHDDDDDQNDGTLKITKTVAGNQGDKTKDFSFTVTFTAPEVLPANTTAEQYLAAITVNGETDKVSNGVATFTLKDGQTATFGNIIAGTKYAVEETAVAGYTPSWSATANGVTVTDKSGILIGEKANSGTMTNKHEDVTPTGVIMNNAPFVVTLAVAAAGVVAYGSAKRKLEK